MINDKAKDKGEDKTDNQNIDSQVADKGRQLA